MLVLENKSLIIQTAYEQARTLEMAKKHSASSPWANQNDFWRRMAPPLKIRGLAAAKVSTPFLFRNLLAEWKPTAIEYAIANETFIEKATECMLLEEIIRPSN
ncbi:hypothetical protein SK128_006297 [Halocaridina rubra]|uniref:Uncharacterized protein n=1 Tax=Halocaridina rubra TaxID=373956 RepID=A0AAN8XTY4_HALRR